MICLLEDLFSASCAFVLKHNMLSFPRKAALSQKLILKKKFRKETITTERDHLWERVVFDYEVRQLHWEKTESSKVSIASLSPG